MSSIVFQCMCNSTKPGDEIFLVGAHPAFGDWDYNKGIRLQTGSQLWPKWRSGVVYLPFDPRPLEYKYLIRCSNGEFQWEPFSENRVITFDEEGSYTVYNHWGALDRHERPPQHNNFTSAAPGGRPSLSDGTNSVRSTPHPNRNPNQQHLSHNMPPQTNNPRFPASDLQPLHNNTSPQPYAPPLLTNHPAPSSRSSYHPPPIGSPDWHPSPNPPSAPHALLLLSQVPASANYNISAASASGSAANNNQQNFGGALNNPCSSPVKNSNSHMPSFGMDTAQTGSALSTKSYPTQNPQNISSTNPIPGTSTTASNNNNNNNIVGGSTSAGTGGVRRGGGSMTIDRRMFIRDRQGRLEEHFEILEHIGEGTWGTVFRVRDKMTGLVRAAKQVPKAFVDDLARFKSEVETLKRLDHPNIVRLFESFEDDSSIFMIQEECVGGELFDYLYRNTTSAQNGASAFSERDACRILHQILSALAYCHAHGVVHRDVKAENFLFLTKSYDSPLKLIDFGLAAMFNPLEPPPLTTKVGTPYYVAPEILTGEYSYPVDVWSAGILFYLLLVGYPPFNGRNDGAILQAVKRGRLLFPTRDWSHISAGAKELCQMLLTRNPQERLNAAQALTHPIFKLYSSSCSAPQSSFGLDAALNQNSNRDIANPATCQSVSVPATLRTTSNDLNVVRDNEQGDLSHNPLLFGNSQPPAVSVPSSDNLMQRACSANQSKINNITTTNMDDHFLGTSSTTPPPLTTSGQISSVNSNSHAVQSLSKRRMPSSSRVASPVDVVSKLRRFKSLTRLKKLFLTILAQQCGDTELNELRDLFLTIDVDSKGWITTDDLVKYVASHPSSLHASGGASPALIASNLESLLHEVDTTGAGVLDYTGFLAACLGRKQYVQENICRAAFAALDLDGDGKVTKDELMRLVMQTVAIDPGSSSMSSSSNTGQSQWLDFIGEEEETDEVEEGELSSSEIKSDAPQDKAVESEKDTINQQQQQQVLQNDDQQPHREAILKELDEDLSGCGEEIDFDSFFSLIRKVPSCLFGTNFPHAASHASRPMFVSSSLSRLASSHLLNLQQNNSSTNHFDGALPYSNHNVHSGASPQVGHARSGSRFALISSRANMSSAFLAAAAQDADNALIHGQRTFLDHAASNTSDFPTISTANVRGFKSSLDSLAKIASNFVPPPLPTADSRPPPVCDPANSPLSNIAADVSPSHHSQHAAASNAPQHTCTSQRSTIPAPTFEVEDSSSVPGLATMHLIPSASITSKQVSAGWGLPHHASANKYSAGGGAHSEGGSHRRTFAAVHSSQHVTAGCQSSVSSQHQILGGNISPCPPPNDNGEAALPALFLAQRAAAASVAKTLNSTPSVHAGSNHNGSQHKG